MPGPVVMSSQEVMPSQEAMPGLNDMFSQEYVYRQ